MSIYIDITFFFFKQKTAYEVRISDWSSDVCSSDLTTRSDLARVTGLTPPTIVNITKRLIDLGLVKPAGRLQGKRGQPAMRIVIDPDGAFAIGLNIDRDHITLVTLDLAGQIRSRHTREIAFAPPETVVDHELGNESCRERVCPYE